LALAIPSSWRAQHVEEALAGGGAGVVDLRKIDRHRLASVATLVLGLRCSWCPELAPMPKTLGLHALPPAGKAAASIL
jgi:hypothetical protein